MRMEEAFYNIKMYLDNINVLEYAQIARSGPKSVIRDIEGLSNIHVHASHLWNYKICLFLQISLSMIFYNIILLRFSELGFCIFLKQHYLNFELILKNLIAYKFISIIMHILGAGFVQSKML